MKKIKTTAIAGTVKAPYIKQTFEHYNEAIQESLNAFARGLIPSSWATGNIVIMQGAVVSATIPGTSSITAGFAYYEGEFFTIDVNASLITTGLQTLVWVIETTYASGDPVQYSDGNNHDQHEIRKLKLQAGLTGTGLMDYNASTVRYMTGNGTASTIASTTNITSSNVGVISFQRQGNICRCSLTVEITITATLGYSFSITAPSGFEGTGTNVSVGIISIENLTAGQTGVYANNIFGGTITFGVGGSTLSVSVGNTYAPTAGDLLRVTCDFSYLLS